MVIEKEKIRILIAEDSPLVIKKVKELLSELDFIEEIISCRTYSEAVCLADILQPDIALLDINLTGKSGIDILDYIKETHPKIKTIMFTNQSGEYYHALCKKKGVDHFIDKSKDFGTLPHVLRSLT